MGTVHKRPIRRMYIHFSFLKSSQYPRQQRGEAVEAAFEKINHIIEPVVLENAVPFSKVPEMQQIHGGEITPYVVRKQMEQTVATTTTTTTTTVVLHHTLLNTKEKNHPNILTLTSCKP